MEIPEIVPGRTLKDVFEEAHRKGLEAAGTVVVPPVTVFEGGPGEPPLVVSIMDGLVGSAWVDLAPADHPFAVFLTRAGKAGPWGRKKKIVRMPVRLVNKCLARKAAYAAAFARTVAALLPGLTAGAGDALD